MTIEATPRHTPRPTSINGHHRWPAAQALRQRDPLARPAPIPLRATVTVQLTVHGADADIVAAKITNGLRLLGADGTEVAISTPDTEPRLRAVKPSDPSAPLQIQTARRVVALTGTALDLTRREYDLLLFLAEHAGRVFTRTELLRRVWGQNIISGERTVDVHVRRLRRKLTAAGPSIATVRGVGYRLDDPDRVSVHHGLN